MFFAGLAVLAEPRVCAGADVVVLGEALGVARAQLALGGLRVRREHALDAGVPELVLLVRSEIPVPQM